MENCIFCSNKVQDNKIMENELAFVVYDIYPKSKGHALIIPKRHSENYFETTVDEQAAMSELLLKMKHLLQTEHNPVGFNILSNIGKDAGQVVFHTHLHLIPRYEGEDVKI